MGRAGPRREHGIWGHHTPPHFQSCHPIVPMWGLHISGEGGNSSPSLSVPAFPALGGEGRAAEIFIYFLYLFNFFFFFLE